MTEIKVIRDDEKATEIIKAIRCIDNGTEIAPVVRCGDCRYFDNEAMHCDHHMSTMLPLSRKACDFCSYGERRDDNELC